MCLERKDGTIPKTDPMLPIALRSNQPAFVPSPIITIVHHSQPFKFKLTLVSLTHHMFLYHFL